MNIKKIIMAGFGAAAMLQTIAAPSVDIKEVWQEKLVLSSSWTERVSFLMHMPGEFQNFKLFSLFAFFSPRFYQIWYNLP